MLTFIHIFCLNTTIWMIDCTVQINNVNLSIITLWWEAGKPCDEEEGGKEKMSFLPALAVGPQIL